MAGESPIVLGRYELHAAIATGGMASIHLGRLRGPAGFARTVAIKRLHPQYARDETFVAMFMDEARLVARIQHPNVVPILDVVAEGDELFLVMEYVHGESLSALVFRGAEVGIPAPPAIAAAIFVDVLHGLHAAHEAKTAEGEPLEMVHRDVTPHNVLVGVDGAARIADFGIAMATQRTQKTQEGQLKGKLCYVAPEQLQGREVGRATDVYAAAVSLWEALTGRVLFGANHEGRIVEKILVGASKPPSSLASMVTNGLDEVVMRGLDMKPQRRFQTAREMALALERSIALPPASEVSAWVTSRAAPKLAIRAAAIEAIERAAALPPTPVPTGPPAGMSATMPMPLPGPPRVPSPDPDPVSMSIPMAKNGRRALVLVLLASVIGGGVVWARARARANSAAATAPSASTSASSAWADLAPPPTDHPSAVAPPTAPRPSTTVRPPAPPPPPSPTTPRPAKSAADDDCKPPYTRDAEGRKIYKRECL